MAINLIKNPNERNDPQRPLLEHLIALKESLILAMIAWVICAIVAGCFSELVLMLLKAPAGAYQELLQGLDLMSGFSIVMCIAIWGGTILSFPFLIYALLRFIFPALTNREKGIILSILIVGTVLFLVGVALAYIKTLPMIVVAFQSINKWVGLSVTTMRIEGYISIVLKTIVAFGLVFQLPIIIFVLGCLGVVSSKGLRAKRKAAIVIAFIVSMFLTPPDPMSQIIMAVPLCFLYEISIWAVWLKEKGSFK